MIKESQINHFINLIRNHNRNKRQRKATYFNKVQQSYEKSNINLNLNNKYSNAIRQQKTQRHFYSLNHYYNKHNCSLRDIEMQKSQQFSRIMENGKKVKTQITDLSFNVQKESKPKNFYDQYRQELQKKSQYRRFLNKKSQPFFTQSFDKQSHYSNGNRHSAQKKLQEIPFRQSNSNSRINFYQKRNHHSLKAGLAIYDNQNNQNKQINQNNQNKEKSSLIKKKVNQLTFYQRKYKPKTKTYVGLKNAIVFTEKNQRKQSYGNIKQNNDINVNSSFDGKQIDQDQDRERRIYKFIKDPNNPIYLKKQKVNRQSLVGQNIQQMKKMMRDFNNNSVNRKSKAYKKISQQTDFFNNNQVKLQGWRQINYFQDGQSTPFPQKNIQHQQQHQHQQHI